MICFILVSKIKGKKPWIKIKLEILIMYASMLVLLYIFTCLAFIIETGAFAMLVNPTYKHYFVPNYQNAYFTFVCINDFILMILVNKSRKLKKNEE